MFSSQLKHNVGVLGLPSSELLAVLSSVKAIDLLAGTQKEAVVGAYIASIEGVFLMGVPSAAIAAFISLGVRRERLQSVPGIA